MSLRQRRAVLLFAALALIGSLFLFQQAFGQVRAGRKAFPPGLPLAQTIPMAGGEKDSGEFSHAISLPKDNSLKKQIEAAGDYVKTEDWVTACEVLQKLVTIREDVFVQLPRPGSDGKERPVWTSVRAEANRLIATLPRKGLEFYKLTYNPPALEMLKQAKASSDVSLLAQVMRAYLHTDPGSEATNLLGTYHLDRGNFVTASLCFERLLNREGAGRLAPNTLFKAAYAFHQAGDKANEEQVWKMLGSRVREVALGTEKKSVAELKDYVSRLVRVNAERNVNDWSIFGGTESRSGQGVGGPAFMEHRWKQPTVRSPKAMEWIQSAEKHLADRQQPVLSAFFPVTATVTRHDHKVPLIIFRSYWGIHAYDMKKGSLEWQTPSPWSIDRMLDERTTGGANKVAIENWVSFYLQNNNRPSLLFENSTLGCLSTDNTFLFAVDDLAVPPPPQYQNGMGFDGRFNHGFGGLNAEVQDAIMHSRLQAFELTTGKLKWVLGGRGEKGDLTDCYFLGPPLPLAGKLYALTEKQQELRLVCIDPVRGRVLSSQALATTRDKMQQDVARRTQAAHLAYGEGILVCPTNAGAILGVDLLSHSLVWACLYREKGQSGEDWTPGVGGNGRFIRPGMIVGPDGNVFNPTMNSQWKVSAPVIQDGKVVFAAPDARSVQCLNLRDGSVLWTQPRGDEDLYLAGVFCGKALIVGKKTVRAIALNGKGETLWSLETGLPSGQGIASDNVYYLPLKESGQGKEPEICAIDMEAGRIVAHTKSRKKEVPGNLLFYEGDVLSQTPTEVAVFPQLKVKLAQIDELISKNPADPVGLTERGELRLDEGNLEGAIADLSKAIKNGPPPEILGKARGKLYETLTEYFQRDFNKAEPFLPIYEELCKVDLNGANDEQKAERQIEERRRRANFLCLVAKGKESQRKLVEAFEKYQEFAAITGNQELISVVDEPTVKAAPDVWSRGRIHAMIASATDAERKPLEDLVARKWQELRKRNDLNELRNFVSVFGSLFAAGKEARMLLAERLMNDPEPRALLEAELHLSLLRGPGEPAETAARALEATARLYLAKNLFPDAAYCYKQLQEQYPDVVIADGKTGADFFNEMATDKRLQPYLDAPARLGASGKIKVIEERQYGGFPYQFQVYNFDQAGEPLPFFQMHRLGLRFLDAQHHLKLTERTTGEERWNLALTRTMFQGLINRGIQPNLPKFAFQNLGHLVILPVGHLVFAIDPVNKQLLWERNLFTATQPGSGPSGNPPGFDQNNFQLLVDPRDNTLQVIYADGWTQRLGGAGPLLGSVICLQTRDALVAIDPVTNRTLWTRSDISPRCQIFGDDRHIYVVEMNSENHPTATRAMRADDGVTFKVPDFAALFEKRQRVIGRALLVSDTDARNVTTLRLYDVLTGKDLWKEAFPANAIVLKSEDPNLGGMVDLEGKIRVFDLRLRKEVLTAHMDPRHLDRVESVHLLRDSKDFFIACKGPNDPNMVGLRTNLMPNTGLRALPVSGAVYSFDRVTGKLRWYVMVPNQMMVLDQFQDLPIVLFTAQYPKWLNNGPGRGIGQQSVAAVKSIDKRTGKLLYDNDNMPNGTGLYFYALNIDARAGRIEFIGQQMKITHLLNSDTLSSTNKVGAANSSRGDPYKPVGEFRIFHAPAVRPGGRPAVEQAVPR